MNVRNLLLSLFLGGVALVAGALCHRFTPGLGLVLMPMFWPLAVLGAKVPAKYSVTTAALVPFASLLLTGMPAFPVVVAVKFAIFTGAVSFVFRRLTAHSK